MKKRILCLLIATLSCSFLMSQDADLGMRYQAIARNLDGTVITNEAMQTKVELLTVSPVEKVLFQELHTVTSNQFGLLNLTIGEGNSIFGEYEEIPWSKQNVWVRISIRRAADDDFKVVSSSRLYSVPFAHFATKAGSLADKEFSPVLRAAPSGGNVWSLNGNKDASKHHDPPVLGTVDDNPVVFITNNMERLRIAEDGTVKITGDLNVGEDAIIGMDLTVKQDVDLNTEGGETNINGATTIGGDDMNPATFTGPVQMNKTLNVDGNTTVNGTTVLGGVAMNSTTHTGNVQMNKTLNVDGNTTINGTSILGGAAMNSTTHTGNVQMNKNLNVDGITTIGGVNMNPATFKGDVQMEKDLDVDGTATIQTLDVEGESTFGDRTIFDITVTGAQTDQSSYPVLIKGSKQGLAIDLTPNTTEFKSHRGNNYVSFWRDGSQTGRIEGMGYADLDPTGLVSLLVGMVNSPPTSLTNPSSGPGVTYSPYSVPGIPVDLTSLLNFSKGSLPSLSGGCIVCENPHFPTLNKGTLPGLSFLSLQNLVGFSNPFSGGSPLQGFSGFLNSFNGNTTANTPARFIWENIRTALMSTTLYPMGEDQTNFESQIFSNYTLDILLMGISTVESIVTFITSLGSVLDPEDIFSEGVGLVSNIISLIIYGSYADINLGVAYESGAGDYAEWLLRADPSELISPGDIVGVIGGKISKEFTHADRFMAVSTSPILLGNMPKNSMDERLHEKVAFMGQVPVKVQGQVNIGDYILPSGEGDGIGIAVSPKDMLARDYQRIIGVAWEASGADQFLSLVNTAVGVNHNDLSKVIEQMQFTLNHIQETVKKLDPTYEVHQYEVSQTEFSQQVLDYNVSPTHHSNVAQYFQGKSYTDNADLLADVKEAMTNQGGVDFSQVPIVEYILDHPNHLDHMVREYKTILNEMITVRDGIMNTTLQE